MLISKEDLFNTEMFMVEEMYLPFLGKCEVRNPFQLEKQTVIEVGLKPWNRQRKDENGTRYDITGDVDWTKEVCHAKIDFDLNVVTGYFFKEWIGGTVERFDFSYPIQLEAMYAETDALGMVFVKLNCEAGN